MRILATGHTDLQRRAAAITNQARLLRSDDKARVVRRRIAADHLHLEVAQHVAHDGADLQVGERHADAAVLAAAKANQRVGRLLALVTRRRKAVGVKLVWVLKDFGHAVRQRRRHHRHPALGHHVVVKVEVAHDLAHQHDQRRVHALGLDKQALQLVHGADVFHRHQLLARHHLVLLLDQRSAQVRVTQQLDVGPRGHDGAGVLAAKQQRQDQPRDLVIGQRAVLLLVARRHQGLDEVFLDRSSAPTLGGDLRAQADDLGAGFVTLAERRNRQAGREEGNQVNAALQVVIELGKVRRHVVAEVAAEQAAAGDKDGQLVGGGVDVSGAFATPAGKVALALLVEVVAVGAHARVPQGRVHKAKLLVHDLGRRVVDDPFAKHRDHHLVGLAGRELLVAGPEKRLVGARTREHRRHLPGQV